MDGKRGLTLALLALGAAGLWYLIAALGKALG